MVETLEFDDVTLLVTHYNRSKSLEKLLYGLRFSGCKFKHIVISDDCSSQQHRDYLYQLKDTYNFQLITSVQNKGLGNNINKGQDIVNTSFTLYIQEDFVPSKDFKNCLSNALRLLRDEEEYDMVRFYAYKKYPYLINYKYGFSKMIYRWWYPGLGKFAYYSDHPHLRRTSFFDKFGRYREGISGDKTEFSMMMSFLRNGGRAFFYNEYKSVLDQSNSSSEPSTMKRNIWRESDNFFITFIRKVYRYLNYYICLYLINK